MANKACGFCLNEECHGCIYEEKPEKLRVQPWPLAALLACMLAALLIILGGMA